MQGDCQFPNTCDVFLVARRGYHALFRGGATESEENPFEAIFDQNQTKIGVALPSDVAQFSRTEAEMFFGAGLVTIATLDTGA
jgi:hypothetical protein